MFFGKNPAEKIIDIAAEPFILQESQGFPASASSIIIIPQKLFKIQQLASFDQHFYTFIILAVQKPLIMLQ